MRRKICIVCVVFSFCCRAAQATSVWIDTDVTVASPFREADDAFALLLALHSADLHIAGISTSYGNGPLPLVDASARDLANRFGQGAGISAMMVHGGARSAAHLGSPSAATDALSSALKKRRLTYLALGPLTNLASFLLLHPEAARQFDRIVFIGGRTSADGLRFNSIRLHDANVVKDPAAVQVVLSSNIPMVLIPIDVAGRFGINRQDRLWLHKSGPCGRYLTQKSALWFWFWTNIVGRDEAPIFDALAVVAAAQPHLISLQQRRGSLSPSRQLLELGGTPRSGRVVSVCTAFRSPECKNLMLQRLSRGASVKRSASFSALEVDRTSLLEQPRRQH